MITVEQLMLASQVSFGTSGLRGLVTALTDRCVYGCTQGYVRYLEGLQDLPERGPIALGGDLRPSTQHLMNTVGRAITDAGHAVINLGNIPTPAGAYFGLVTGMPFVMVTGSHIPADRNGIKYYRAHGEEILKSDETGLNQQEIHLSEDLFASDGSFRSSSFTLPPVTDARSAYSKRYTDFFGAQSLKGLSVGVYEHSSVGRDILCHVLEELGVSVVRLGYSEDFIPVDTEALSAETRQQIQSWMNDNHLNLLVSTDGDSDRPLVVYRDETGQTVQLHGDRLNIITAREMAADCVVTTVNCNSGVEASGYFAKVIRTKIGSPYVIAAMNREQQASPASCILGYEANGGLLLRSPLRREGLTLSPLSTRDALLPILLFLTAVHKTQCDVLKIVSLLPQRYTTSVLTDMPVESSQKLIAMYHVENEEKNIKKMRQDFNFLHLGPVISISDMDGLRVVFADGSIIHIRPSGNAPQLRVYAEANSQALAEINSQKMLSFLLTLFK